ncbi:MAG: hypothetical protein IT428_10385 [Planctomycetaceae bacterium]|nr:hypothetical protein [Planctomycetaceae bacterium]
METRSESCRRALFAVLALAFVVRIVAAIGLQHVLDNVLHRPFLIEGDANGYWTLAEGILEGRDYALYDPPRRVLRMPGFPLLLAAGQKIADVAGISRHRPLVTRLLLAVVGTAACGAVYLLGRTLFDARTGVLAAGLCAVSPAFVLFSVQELSETAFALGLVLSLWCLARLIQTLRGESASTSAESRSDMWPVVGWSLATGMAIAGANYKRPSWMLAGPAFAVLIAIVSPRKLRGLLAGMLVLGSMFLCLTPWAWRNERVTGHWVWTTLWVGASLYDGLHPQATGDSDMRFFDQENLMATMTEFEVDREYRRRANEFIRQNPGRALQLGVIKQLRYWNPVPNAAQFSSWWMQLPLAVWFGAMIASAAFGSWEFQGKWIALVICVAPILYFAAVHSVFVGSLRYRLPAEYPLLIVSAAGFLAVWRRRRQNGLPEMSGKTYFP